MNQLFIRVSYTQIKFSKNEVVSVKSPFFVIAVDGKLYEWIL